MDPQVFRTFDDLITGPNGGSYLARICGGREDDNGLWHGWIEFVGQEGGTVLRSPRETRQPNRRNLDGWADRLSRVYLEGSLRRTLRMQEPKRTPAACGPDRPRFSAPAPEPGRGRPVAPDDAALNPFLRYREGEPTLREELEHLPPSELRTVIEAYRLAEDPDLDADALEHAELVELVVRTVRERVLR